MSETPVDTKKIDSSKRTWLIASGCAGAVGGLATAVPFVSTFQPSERAKAAGAPVEFDHAIAGLRRFYTADPVGNRIEFLEER